MRPDFIHFIVGKDLIRRLGIGGLGFPMPDKVDVILYSPPMPDADPEVLKQMYQKLVEHYAPKRLVFTWEDGTPAWPPDESELQ